MVRDCSFAAQAVRRIAAFLVATFSACTGFAAEPPDGRQQQNLLGALTQGEFRLGFRYRVEEVDDGAFAHRARASTLRTRLTWRSAAWRRWSALAEVDDVHALGADQYNSTRNGETRRPLVADPDGTELNQATIQYSADRYSLLLGRQRLNLDNQRFIGSSAWRQNEQTFDAVTLRARLPRHELTYSRVANVNRSVGPEGGAPPADLRGDIDLLNLATDARALGAVSVFAYLLDFENAAALSSRTYGLRWTGSHPFIGELRALHAASVAFQEDNGANAADFQARHWQLEAGLRLRGWTLTVGRESLSGDPTSPDRSFQTPLATLHAFHGWTEKFTTTPPEGLEDTYVGLAGSRGYLKVELAWHEFAAQARDRDYGSAWNGRVSYQIAKGCDVMLKAADYSSTGFSSDSTKLWLMLSASF